MRRKEYILSNEKGNKIYLSFQQDKSGDQAFIRTVSFYERKLEDVYLTINNGMQIEILKELAKRYPVPFAFDNDSKNEPRDYQRRISELNIELLKFLNIDSDNIENDNVKNKYYFIGNTRGIGYFFKSCVINDHLYDSIKDKIALLKKSSINRFQFIAENGSTFSGRTAELHYLTEMCENTDAPFCWTAVCGKGGIGKSRLALELCERLSKEGWIVYPPAHARIKAEQIKTDIEKTDTDMVICFDDVNSDIENVLNFMNYCIETPFKQSQKIRLILIDRDFDFEYSPLISSLIYRYQGDTAIIPEVELVDGSLMLKKPSADETFEIMHSFTSNYYKKDLLRSTFDKMLYPTLQQIDKDNERPLFALLIADAWGSGMNERLGYTLQKDVLDMLYEQELGRIWKLIEIEYKPSEQKKAKEAAKCFITLSSFLNESWADIHKKIINKIAHFDMDDSFYWVMEQAGFMKDGMLINPFPDILAEYFSLLYINSIDIKNKDYLISLIEYLLKVGRTRTLNFAAQICDDYADILTPPSNMSVFQYLSKLNKKISDEQWSFLTSVDVQHHHTDESVFNSFMHKKSKQFSTPVYSWIDDSIKSSHPFIISAFHHIHPELRKQLSRYPDNIMADFVSTSVELIISFFEQNKDKIFINTDDPVLNSALSSSNYNGQILFDTRCGQGIYKTPDGSTYEGHWNMNCANGSGIEKSAEGTYDGSWEDGEKSGNGTMEYFDRTKYEGKWWLDMPYGHGIITRPDNVTYECEWAKGQPLGTVTMIFPNKKTIQGEWHNGTIVKEYNLDAGRVNHKKKKITWPDGTIYEGDIKESLPDGEGKLTLFDKTTYSGHFKNGILDGEVTITWYQWLLQPRKEYHGAWKDGKCHGKGIMIYADRSVYDGQWENDERSGTGEMSYPDGRKYYGGWKHDIKFGIGKWTYPDGSVCAVYSDEVGTLSEDGETVTEDGRIITTFPF
ncbi:MAG: hypothetical protein IJI75_13655 [Solobacterium sp.]|nr:hypothetical protein [Solobacterium sp.]